MFILLWLYLFLTFQVCPFFWAIVDKSALDEPYYLYTSFLFCLILNFFISYWRENFNNNKDILYKFFSLFFKPFSIFFTLAYAHLKRFFYFSNNFNLVKFVEFFSNFLNKFNIKSFLIWRPLFRKWSYFGYFKSNRSKWWKNK